MANKVLFGFSDLYIGTYEDNNGTITLGSPYHQAGAVGYSPESSNDQNIFYADNVAYYTTMGNGSYEGDLEVAMFDDAFKTAFLGYIELDDGGLAQVKNPTKPQVYIMFEIQGDVSARRVIMYNGKLGNITRELSTIEETAEPTTETIPTTFVGDNTTGIVMATYEEGDTGYDTLFSNPPVPALPASS